MKFVKCSKCGSEEVTINTVAEGKKRGFFGACMWILLSICTCGLVLLIPLLTKKGTKTVSYAICNKCGYRWKL